MTRRVEIECITSQGPHICAISLHHEEFAWSCGKGRWDRFAAHEDDFLPVGYHSGWPAC